ncbi:MAG: anthranilate synthase component I family protein [Planctomycetota bacterium]|nr:MAG: anthranilate synthase component I family protein [Planctomycetota bacterium]
MTTGTAAIDNKDIICKPNYKKIRAPINLPALSEMFARLESTAILGGNSSVQNAGRFSYWAAEPKDIFEFKKGQKNPFDKLAQALNKYKLNEELDTDLPKGIFSGGWLGYFSYELGRYIEKIPLTTIDDLKMPFIRLCFYDKVICYDHTEGDIWLIALDLPDDIEKPQEKFATLEKLLAKSQEIAVTDPCPADLDNIDFSQIRCNINRDYYLETIKKIKRYIYDGEVYQINFSQRFEADFKAKAIDLFHWQNYYNPSPYAAYIDGGNFHIVSASPEMFITIADGIISTKPIKGTRPRVNQAGQGKKINAKNFEQLVNSEKEQAELNMIIDLERNDVARICKPGTRKVVQPRTIESYPTVFHAVATVAGEVREETTFCDVLRAMFPGGSITGAPKVRSMEIIDETEPTERGVYTGSIGFIGIDGSACLNIAIRTIIIKGQPVLSRVEGKAYAQTGGGIVADSDADAEWDETITKARALLAGINSVQRIAGSV